MIEIRRVSTAAEYRAVEDLQKEVWACDEREIVPAIHMIPASHVGAILLGAFDGEAMIGFAYGFPGFEGEHRIIHSDMLAVRASYRDRGVGRDLKLAQREHALAAGIHRITWTFDPLQSRNAYLNFVRLGVTADRYIRDFYGTTSSPLHEGGTDRLWVTWDLDGASPLRGGEERRIAIPSRATDVRTWRERTRHEFEDAFAAGFVVRGFERGAEMSEYVLTR